MRNISTENKSSFPETEDSAQVLISLRRIMRAIDLHSRQLKQKHNLTGPQLIVLREIVRQDGITTGELAHRASLSNATITGIVDRLEKRGLVERNRGDKDRRQVLVRITESASELLKSAPPLLQERFLASLESLDKRQRVEMLAMLQRVARMMNAEALDVGPVLASEPLTDLSDTLGGVNGQVAGVDFVKKESVRRMQRTKEVFDYPDVGVRIHVAYKPEDLPPWIDRDQLAIYFHESLKPYEDSVEDVQRALDYVFSDECGKGGFVLIADDNEKPIGALLMLHTGMAGYIPENILLFVGVSPDARGKGIGGKIIKKGFELADGDVKLHVEYDNPAKRLYERLGMTSKYAEMRYHK